MNFKQALLVSCLLSAVFDTVTGQRDEQDNAFHPPSICNCDTPKDGILPSQNKYTCTRWMLPPITKSCPSGELCYLETTWLYSIPTGCAKPGNITCSLN